MPHDELPTLSSIGEQLVEQAGRTVRQRDVHDVLGVLRRLVSAVFDGAEVVGTFQHALRQQESGRELAIGPWRAHDDGEWSSVQAALRAALRSPRGPSRPRRGRRDAYESNDAPCTVHRSM